MPRATDLRIVIRCLKVKRMPFEKSTSCKLPNGMYSVTGKCQTLYGNQYRTAALILVRSLSRHEPSIRVSGVIQAPMNSKILG